MQRRKFLGIAGGFGTGLLSGCISDGPATETPTSTPTESRETSKSDLFETSTTEQANPIEYDPERTRLDGVPNTSLNYQLYVERPVPPEELFKFGDDLAVAHGEDVPSKLANFGLVWMTTESSARFQEYQTPYGAERAYEFLKAKKDSAEEHEVDGRTWLTFRGGEYVSQNPDFYGLKQVENVLLSSYVLRGSYDEPREAILAHIKAGPEGMSYDEIKYFNPYVAAVADHYEDSVEYESISLDTDSDSPYAVPMDEFDKSDARAYFEEELAIRPEDNIWGDGIERLDDDPANDTYKAYGMSGPSDREPFLSNAEEWHIPARESGDGRLFLTAKYYSYNSVEAAVGAFKELFGAGPDKGWGLANLEEAYSGANLQVMAHDDGTIIGDAIGHSEFTSGYKWADTGYAGSILRTILSGNALIKIWWKPDDQ